MAKNNQNQSTTEYNRSGWIILLSSVFFSVVWALYFMIVQVPVDLGESEDDIPLTALAGVMENIDISQVEDFWKSSDVMIQKGAQVYSTYCALCHGAKGIGDGIAGRGLKPPPRDFTKSEWKFGGTSIAIFKVISEGSPGTSMASFSHIPKKDRWALVHFVRSLNKTPIADDPAKTKEFAQSAK